MNFTWLSVAPTGRFSYLLLPVRFDKILAAAIAELFPLVHDDVFTIAIWCSIPCELFHNATAIRLYKTYEIQNIIYIMECRQNNKWQNHWNNENKYLQSKVSEKGIIFFLYFFNRYFLCQDTFWNFMDFWIKQTFEYQTNSIRTT